MSGESGCRPLRRRLEALVDGDLDPIEAASLRAHLAGCPACASHHAEAASLPGRLAALGGPPPPPGLVHGVIRRVREDRPGPFRLWGLMPVEIGLFLAALWYLSGLDGLASFAGRTAADVGAFLSWGLGESEPPATPSGDLFLLLVAGLLLATTLFHLVLLARQQRLLTPGR